MTKMIVFVCLCLIVQGSLGAQIQWTGAAGNSLWNFASNWLNNTVPTANDDVIINALGGSNIQVSAPAAARSVTIAGGQYSQSLDLVSQLSVGAGGINVQKGGTLQLQSNNELPLTSQGDVTIQAGATFSFVSGAITGPGQYIITVGAVLTFSQSALKLISAANLTNWGSATVQGSTIEIEKAGSFVNNGNLTVIGAGNIFSTDFTGSVSNYGAFSYQGESNALIFDLNTYFYTLLDISSGDLTLSYNFKSNATVNVPQGSTLTVGAGTTVKQFNIIKGQGILEVQGTAIVAAPISLSVFEVSDSGSLTLNSAASFASCSIGGILNTQAALSVTNMTLRGGSITGPGTTSISGYMWVNSSDTGNTNNFITSTVILYGQGMTATPIYMLLGNGGQFHIASGGSFFIQSSFQFGVEAGKPLVIVDGTLSASASVTTNVDIAGSGTFKMNGGNLIANGDTFTIGTLFLANSVTASLNTVTLTAGTVTGAGSLNLTAAPAPVSSISTVSIVYFGVVNGAVSVGTFAVTTFDFWTGTVTLAGGSSNTASTINMAGGTLTGAAKITTASLNLALTLPATFSGVAIKTSTLTVQSSGAGTIQIQNGATIISDSTMMATYTRSGVAIN